MAAAALVGCGGDDSAPVPPVVPPGASTAQIISAAAADPANDSATNSAAPFTVMQSTTVPAVQVNSPPVVNFTVFSDGKVVQGLTNANARFAIAKLTPAANGDPDRWDSYVFVKETTTPPYGPNGTPVLPSAWQATTDPNTPAQLVYNPDGYYTYTFSTDITDPAKTNGVVYEPGKTHRIAIQLSYQNAAGETILVNPYFDFTIGADGKSVTVTDPNATRVMADTNSCNACHEKLALHGGGRVDVQYCVICHNPGTTDANSGNVLTMSTMTHQIHAGRLLASTPGGVDYTIWGYRNSKHDYAEVGFPQDLRNCAVCHSSDPTKTKTPTPQGDNWKTKVSKEACLTCHANNAGSDWNTTHTTYFGGTDPKKMTNAQCVACHNPTTNPALSPERVHWNQNEENAALYKMNIESATFDAGARKVTVKYFLSNPMDGDAAYNLITPDCTAPAPNVCTVPEPPPSRSVSTKFGNLRFYLAYQNMVGQFPAITEFSSYNNGGNSVSASAYKGVNDGNNHYTIDIPLPPDSAIAVASGTARVISIGQVKEVKLAARSATDPRPPVIPPQRISTVVQNTYRDVVLSGPMMARRDVVSNEKCNVCHGALGTASGSNTLANAFHDGGNNTVESCVLCHDANRASSTVMTSGFAFNESYQAKRMIHGIHGNSKRLFPFTHGNSVQGAFCNPSNPASVAPLCDPNLSLAAGVENYAAEVAWPGVGLNCNACHIDNSYQTDQGTLGAVVLKGAALGAPADANPNNWKVISPQAASCTSCHDSPTAIGHVTSFGGSSWGNRTQGEIAQLPRETCSDCHSPGGFKGVDIVHGLK
jgi:OmcA/MtrC family decaheme c-type cytochrome